MSESDLKEVIKKYNSSLNKYSIEKYELQNKLSYLMERIDDKQSTSMKLYQEREALINEI
jgi:hypothetical protein